MKFRKQLLKNRLLSQIRPSNRSGSHINCIRISTHNNINHEMAKARAVYYLIERGFECFTEAIIGNNECRADIMAISPDSKGYIIEIMYSETLKELNEKVTKYPKDFEIIKLRHNFKPTDLDF